MLTVDSPRCWLQAGAAPGWVLVSWPRLIRALLVSRHRSPASLGASLIITRPSPAILGYSAVSHQARVLTLHYGGSARPRLPRCSAARAESVLASVPLRPPLTTAAAAAADYAAAARTSGTARAAQQWGCVSTWDFSCSHANLDNSSCLQYFISKLRSS